MIRGIYTATAGLATATLRLGVVSNNIANASTPGYKQDRLPAEVGKAIDLQRWAVDAQGQPVGSIVLGPQVGVSQLDLTPGPLQETSNPLDLALAGTGFFSVQSRRRHDPVHPRRRLSRRPGRLTAHLATVPPSWTRTVSRFSIPAGADMPVAADGRCWRTAPRVGQLQVVDFAAWPAADQSRQWHVHRTRRRPGAADQPARRSTRATSKARTST